MLTGKLTRLRPMEMTDLDNYVTWINDPDVVHFLGDVQPLMSRAAEEAWLEANVAKVPGWGDLSLAMETAEGRHIGSIALHDFNPRRRSASLGLMIGAKDCWNRGYGTDAIVTLLRHGFDELNLHRIWLTVDQDNARGIACYRKCGFVEEGRLRDERFTEGRYVDTIVMGILDHEFYEKHGRTMRS